MRRVSLLVLGLLMSGSVFGEQAWTLLGADVDAALNQSERRQVAEDLGSRLEVLRSKVPLQSPADRTSVEERLAKLGDVALASERRGRFFLSLDYQHYQLAQLLDGASEQLRCIREATDESIELTCWSRLAQIYLAEERLGIGLSTLRAARLLPRDDKMPSSAQDPTVWYTEFGRGILRRIITPWLEAHSTTTGAD